MPALIPKENLVKTGRWDTFDVLFKLKSQTNNEYCLGATHEEIVTPLISEFISSYKNLPIFVYQIQTKFRDEKRAKSGILRGREFRMKDLYSFSKNEENLDSYYETVLNTYKKIYKRLGLSDITYVTYASGGDFTKYSHEFQTLSSVGEDLIHICDKCNIAINDEIIEDQKVCPVCGFSDLRKEKAIEVGNIFKLKTKFSEPFSVKYSDENNKENLVYMGCYGIGSSRVMGTIVEVSHDDSGIIWPEEIAPFKYHIIPIGKDEEVLKEANKLYNTYLEKGDEVLFDDRDESTGSKLKDADLISASYRIIVSKKTLEQSKFELKKRSEEEVQLISL
jgi:prolyl-tRNA synthetase